MEMETEDDVAMEGDMHDSSTAAGTIVTENLAENLQPDNYNVETTVLEKVPIAQ
jgi:hypothetical protein